MTGYTLRDTTGTSLATADEVYASRSPIYKLGLFASAIFGFVMSMLTKPAGVMQHWMVQIPNVSDNLKVSFEYTFVALACVSAGGP